MSSFDIVPLTMACISVFLRLPVFEPNLFDCPLYRVSISYVLTNGFLCDSFLPPLRIPQQYTICL